MDNDIPIGEFEIIIDGVKKSIKYLRM